MEFKCLIVLWKFSTTQQKKGASGFHFNTSMPSPTSATWIFGPMPRSEARRAAAKAQAEAALKAAADKLLANTVIENYRVEVIG